VEFELHTDLSPRRHKNSQKFQAGFMPISQSLVIFRVMKSKQKTIRNLVILWLLCLAVRFLFYHEINEELWVLSLLIDGGLVLAGVILLIVLLCLKRRGAVVAAVVIGGFIWLGWFTSIGWQAGTYFRMWRLESTYEKEVTRIMALDDEALEGLKSSADVDEGPPRRVAFGWGGIIDNWSGIVYDPSGEVMLVRESEEELSKAEEAERDRIRSLFGGDLIKATHLWGPWYYCVFT
jgi:hypothetical protein